MACHQFGAKPLPEPMMTYSIGLSGTNFNEIRIKTQKYLWKYCWQNGSHFVYTSAIYIFKDGQQLVELTLKQLSGFFFKGYFFFHVQINKYDISA